MELSPREGAVWGYLAGGTREGLRGQQGAGWLAGWELW